MFIYEIIINDKNYIFMHIFIFFVFHFIFAVVRIHWLNTVKNVPCHASCITLYSSKAPDDAPPLFDLFLKRPWRRLRATRSGIYQYIQIDFITPLKHLSWMSFFRSIYLSIFLYIFLVYLSHLSIFPPSNESPFINYGFCRSVIYMYVYLSINLYCTFWEKTFINCSSI